MIKHTSYRINTFSVGFDQIDLDESERARSISNFFGTNHTTVRFSSKDALSLIPQLNHYFDEPFSDPSALPLLALSSKAKDLTSVVLTGDGGDEFFRGYPWHYADRALNFFSVSKRIPTFITDQITQYLSRTAINKETFKTKKSRLNILNCKSQLDLWLFLVGRQTFSDNSRFRALLSRYYSPCPYKSSIESMSFVLLDTSFTRSLSVNCPVGLAEDCFCFINLSKLLLKDIYFIIYINYENLDRIIVHFSGVSDNCI